MKTQGNTFTLTQEDKLNYLDQINKFDLSKKKELMKSVPEKLQTLLQNGTLNSIQVQLINDLVHLFKLLEDNPNMDKDIQKKILQVCYTPQPQEGLKPLIFLVWVNCLV